MAARIGETAPVDEYRLTATVGALLAAPVIDLRASSIRQAEEVPRLRASERIDGLGRCLPRP